MENRIREYQMELTQKMKENSVAEDVKASEAIKNISDEDVITAATKMMDRFDDAFKELAK